MISREAKRYIFLGVMFSILAITFAVLYHFHVIKTLDLYLAVTYVSYFVGIGLMYSGAYNRENVRKTSTILNFSIGLFFIIGSIILLVYGLVSGIIVLF